MGEEKRRRGEEKEQEGEEDGGGTEEMREDGAGRKGRGKLNSRYMLSRTVLH